MTKACSCIGETTVASGLKSSDLVLSGKVIQKTVIDVIDSSDHELFKSDSGVTKDWYSSKIAKFVIVTEEVIKGEISSDTLTIYTGMGHGDCGFPFIVGDRYIIYGKKKDYFGQDKKYDHLTGKNVYWTNICSRTLEFNAKELQELKEAVKAK